MKTTLLLVLLVTTLAADAGAQFSPPPGVSRSDERPALLRDVGLEQRLGERIPLDLPFRDEAGRDVTLDRYFGERPVVLALAYFECPMLCTQVLTGLSHALRAVPFDLGDDYAVVTVSFDPNDTPAHAAAKKAVYVEDYGRPSAASGWHFLTGDPQAIERLTEAVGFEYRWDETGQQFVHASGIMVLTPDGTLARYFYGIEYSARDLRLGLVDASENRIGTLVDELLLACFHYDPATGKYSVLTMNLVRAGGVLTVLAFVGFVLATRRSNGQGAERGHEPRPTTQD